MASPVKIEGELEAGLSRWLWLVKWFLLIPHWFILFFLWIGFVLATIGAFFVVLFTGRYPRGIFDYNLGVLRWTWRVGFYSYSALGTDRYPPFTLGVVPDYPARIDIEYPGQNRRGLPLIGRWIIGVPQYAIAGLFAGGGTAWAGSYSGGWRYYGGLVSVLVFVAAILLLFRNSYPQEVFDVVMGANRWALRAAAYGVFMSTQYPPFRFEAGGAEASEPPPPPEPEPPAEPALTDGS
jgi:hypothetical protein